MYQRILLIIISIFLFSPLLAVAENYSIVNNQSKIYITIKPANNNITVQPPNNTKIEELIQYALEKQESPWHQGDIIIGSSTIFAFFAFGSWFVIRFQSKQKDEQISLMELILASIGAIQIFHLFAIFTILIGSFTTAFYSYVILSTIIFLVIILFAVRKLIIYENRSEEFTELADTDVKKLETELGKERAIREAVERKLDDVNRELNRFSRESGEY